MNHHTLYLHLAQHLRPLLRPATTPQVNNLALLALGLAESPNCHLATLATVRIFSISWGRGRPRACPGGQPQGLPLLFEKIRRCRPLRGSGRT
jgi:hypothetical protein